MSKLSRLWRTHVEPILDRMFRGGNPLLIPRGVVSLDATRHSLIESEDAVDSAVQHLLAAAPPRCPQTITGNLRYLDQLIAEGLTTAGVDRWWQEVLCSDETSSSALIASINGGRVLHRDGAIIDPNNRLVAGFSGLDFNSEVPGNPLKRKQLSSPQYVPGTLALLTGFASHNYYHWLIDIVPKFAELQAVGLPIDHYFIPQDHAFQRETVRALGIDPKKIIAAQRSSHITSDRILAVAWQGQSVTPSRVQSIRNGFSCIHATNAQSPSTKIYVSRKRSRVRRIENEPALIEMLRSHDFKILTMEDLTMQDQISAFRSAEIIVAPHGAGLANLCFCRPGTKILEITTPYRVLSLFTRLANAAELEFHLHLAKPLGKQWLRGDTAVGDSNILVDIGDFERTLARLLD